MRQDGYFTIDRSVLARTPEIGPVAFAVFAVLAAHANEDGECFPSHATIAAIIGRNDRTVRTALRALESAGLIATKHRRRDTAVYMVQARQPTAAQEPSPAIFDAKPGNFRPPSPATSCRENDNQERQPRTKRQARQPTAAQGFDPLSIRLPFDSERFRQSWQDFAEHRRLIEHPLTEVATTHILRKLTGWGEAKAVDALDLSIENDWRGVFEPKSNGKPHAEDPAPFDN